jgi:hypothetical protein
MFSLIGPPIKLGGDAGLFVPTDTTKPTVVWQYRKGGIFGLGEGDAFGKTGLIVPEETIQMDWSDTSFKRELIYTGAIKGVVTFVYKEFRNDYARPAFTQEIKFDLSEGSTVGYKGARFEILEANNSGIRYKVTKPLSQ